MRQSVKFAVGIPEKESKTWKPSEKKRGHQKQTRP
jgi:hypothetical protein